MYPAKTEEYLKNLKSVFQNLNYPKSCMYILNLICKQYSPFGHLSVDIICSQKQTVFRSHSSRKAASFKKLIMSKEKYLSMFLKPNYVFIMLQIFFATHTWGISEDSSKFQLGHNQSRKGLFTWR